MPDTNETVQVPPEGEGPGEPAPNAGAARPGNADWVAKELKPRRRSSGALVVLAVLVLVAAVIATAFVLIANRRVSMADMRTLLELILGPLFALAGAALGFYFANR